jgi:acyl carrier protein
MIFEKIARIIADLFETEPDEIERETRLSDDLGADSLDVIDIVMSLEDEFRTEVPDEVSDTFETVGDIVDFIEKAVP